MSDLGSRQQFTANDPRARAEARQYPIEPFTITGTTVAAAHALLTAPDNELISVEALIVSNGSGGNLFASVAKSEVAPAASDVVIDRLVIPPNHAIDMGGRVMLLPSQTLYVFASGPMQISGWVRAIL